MIPISFLTSVTNSVVIFEIVFSGSLQPWQAIFTGVNLLKIDLFVTVLESPLVNTLASPLLAQTEAIYLLIGGKCTSINLCFITREQYHVCVVSL